LVLLLDVQVRLGPADEHPQHLYKALVAEHVKAVLAFTSEGCVKIYSFHVVLLKEFHQLECISCLNAFPEVSSAHLELVNLRFRLIQENRMRPLVLRDFCELRAVEVCRFP
jgi:hypothetical protein